MKTHDIDHYHTKIGAVLGTSDWLTIDQAMIDQFAAVTLDDQYIHTDPVRAQNTLFGGTIAHGYLCLSLLTHLCNQATPVPTDATVQINYGLNDVRFISPVHAGSDVAAVVELSDIKSKGASRFLFETKVTLIIKDKDKPALHATILALYER